MKSLSQSLPHPSPLTPSTPSNKRRQALSAACIIHSRRVSPPPSARAPVRRHSGGTKAEVITFPRLHGNQVDSAGRDVIHPRRLGPGMWRPGECQIVKNRLTNILFLINPPPPTEKNRRNAPPSALWFVDLLYSPHD